MRRVHRQAGIHCQYYNTNPLKQLKQLKKRSPGSGPVDVWHRMAYNGFLLQCSLQWIRIVMPSQLKPNASDCQAGVRRPALQYESIVRCFAMESIVRKAGGRNTNRVVGWTLQIFQIVRVAKINVFNVYLT